MDAKVEIYPLWCSSFPIRHRSLVMCNKKHLTAPNEQESLDKIGIILQVNLSSKSYTRLTCTTSENEWYLASERLTVARPLMLYVDLVHGRVTTLRLCPRMHVITSLMESSMPR